MSAGTDLSRISGSDMVTPGRTAPASAALSAKRRTRDRQRCWENGECAATENSEYDVNCTNILFPEKTEKSSCIFAKCVLLYKAFW